ncbi:hypothetical protein [Psychrobacter sp. DAB_AL32B]|uniref:hypothetical protein n=1 Tax=Psychrobacter sp. DAB_AL32B TaxID=1028414 RepID=UPI000B7E5F07|nr:hypothetical protein [Psychrobacter sp. DAB_AL32B]OXL25255.1 hypothetical protein CAN34_04450 [Psychrobacter sp. DAB_AL32B]
MSDKKYNLKILSQVIADSERTPIGIRLVLDTERKEELFRYILHERTQFHGHLRDLVKEKGLPIKPALNEFTALRLEVLRLFFELYATNNYDDEEENFLEVIKNKLMGSYYNELDQNIEQNKHTSAKQITYTAILLTFAEIYLILGEEHHFMNYILGSGNALGVVVANHSYVSYEELEKRKPTPIQRHTDEKKEIAIPLAKRIWSYDKDTNLLMRIQVAALVVDLLPHLGLTIPQVDNWLKKSGEVPPGILKKYAIQDYGNTRNENKLRTQLISKILSELSPIDCRSL